MSLLGLLNTYLLQGIAGNAGYDALKAVWGRITRKSIEDEYLDAFDDALEANASWLSRYTSGELPSLNREELRAALHQDLTTSIEHTPLTTLQGPEFVTALAAAMEARSVLELGGHVLTREEYTSIARSFAEVATARFGSVIAQDPQLFHQTLLLETHNNRALVEQLESHIQTRFNITLEHLSELSNTQHQILERVTDIQTLLTDALPPSVPPNTQAEQDASNAELEKRYSRWIATTTEFITIPGLGVPLSTDTNWIELRARDMDRNDQLPSVLSASEELAAYQAWEKVADSRPSDKSGINIERLSKQHRRLILLGSAGAGKSTLLKRLARRMNTAGKRVLQVRLPTLASRLSPPHGELIDDAILLEAAAGSGIDLVQLRSILGKADYILADGFDECGPNRSQIADALIRWAAGHPNTVIIITTRLAGYEATLFPGWAEAMLLPLEKEQIKDYVRQVLGTLYDDDAVIEKQVPAFEEFLEQHKSYALAARNPLLLGFLIQLFAAGVAVDKGRVDLYQALVELAYRRPVQGRHATVTLSEPRAFLILEQTAWLLTHNPLMSASELRTRLGSRLAEVLSIVGIAGEEEAERGLQFWEEHRILERLPRTDGDLITFVHPSIQEFAAARLVLQRHLVGLIQIEGIENLLPDARFAPALVTAVEGLPWTEACR